MNLNETEKKWLIVGNTSSIIAGIIIEYLLYTIYKASSITPLFKPPELILLLALFPIGAGAYIGYTNSTKIARKPMKYVSPLALILAGAGVIGAGLGNLEVTQAAYLIIAAYFVELAVGIPLSKDFSQINRTASILFAVGVTLFVLSLPLILIDEKYSIIPLIGNTIKITGLIYLIIKIK